MMATLASDQTHLEQARELKEEANHFYTQKDYGKAIRLYHQSLLHARAVQQLSQSGLQGLARFERRTREQEVDEGEGQVERDEDEPLDGPVKSTTERSRIDSTSRGEEMKEEANRVILKCYNNLAACILNGSNRGASDYLRAVDYCEKVLLMDKGNEKALFRKGVCLAYAGLHDKAIDVLKLCPNNKEAQTQIMKCEQILREDRKRRDDEIRRNFARAQLREQHRQLHAEHQNGHGHEMGGAGGDGVVGMENGTTPNGDI